MTRPFKTIGEEEIKKIRSYAGVGLNLDQIAANIGMCRQTLWKLSKEDPRIQDAVREGQSVAALEVTNALYQEARTGKNMTATIFWLKTRLGWREKSEVDINIKPNVTFKTTIEVDGTLVQQILQEDGIIPAEAKAIEGETIQP